MKQVKYTFNGGLPLSQNVLDWQQTAYREVFAAIGNLGWSAGDPVIITGCDDAGAGVYNPGWLFDGTEFYYFQGGDSAAAATTLIKLQELTSTVVFENGASQAIYSRKEYVFDNTGAVDLTTLIPFQQAFGAKFSGLMPGGFSNINVAGGTGNLTGQILLNKLLTAPLLYIRGAIVVQAPAALATPPVYQTVANVGAGFIPPFTMHFKGLIEGWILETGGTLRFNDVNMRITATGNIDMQLIKPDAGVASYTVQFTTIIPFI